MIFDQPNRQKTLNSTTQNDWCECFKQWHFAQDNNQNNKVWDGWAFIYHSRPDLLQLTVNYLSVIDQCSSFMSLTSFLKLAQVYGIPSNKLIHHRSSLIEGKLRSALRRMQTRASVKKKKKKHEWRPTPWRRASLRNWQGGNRFNFRWQVWWLHSRIYAVWRQGG